LKACCTTRLHFPPSQRWNESKQLQVRNIARQSEDTAKSTGEGETNMAETNSRLGRAEGHQDAKTSSSPLPSTSTTSGNCTWAVEQTRNLPPFSKTRTKNAKRRTSGGCEVAADHLDAKPCTNHWKAAFQQELVPNMHPLGNFDAGAKHAFASRLGRRHTVSATTSAYWEPRTYIHRSPKRPPGPTNWVQGLASCSPARGSRSLPEHGRAPPPAPAWSSRRCSRLSRHPGRSPPHRQGDPLWARSRREWGHRQALAASGDGWDNFRR